MNEAARSAASQYRSRCGFRGRTRAARANAAIISPFQAVSTLSSRCGRGRDARRSKSFWRILPSGALDPGFRKMARTELTAADGRPSLRKVLVLEDGRILECQVLNEYTTYCAVLDGPRIERRHHRRPAPMTRAYL